MTTMDLKQDELVVKHYEGLVLMGKFQGYSKTPQGHRVALFRTPEGWVFASDISHVERVNGQEEKAERARHVNA